MAPRLGQVYNVRIMCVYCFFLFLGSTRLRLRNMDRSRELPEIPAADGEYYFFGRRRRDVYTWPTFDYKEQPLSLEERKMFYPLLIGRIPLPLQ